MQLFVSHWRSPLLADVDAQIVSISRGQPRWTLPFRYRRLPELAPSDETWAQETEEGFERSYFDQLEALGANRIVDTLERIGGGRPVVMLCWEKPHESFCHRWMLGRFLLERTGQVVPELQHGDLPEREGALEPRLW